MKALTILKTAYKLNTYSRIDYIDNLELNESILELEEILHNQNMIMSTISSLQKQLTMQRKKEEREYDNGFNEGMDYAINIIKASIK